MSSARKLLCNVYYALAGLALVGTWRQNIQFMSDAGVSLPEGFIQFWPALLANRATISITVDIFLFVLAAVIWMVLEARRLEIRYVWLYVFFAITIAISVTYPLFLAAREKRLAEREAAGTEPKPTGADKAGLIFLGLGSVVFTLWCTFR